MRKDDRIFWVVADLSGLRFNHDLLLPIRNKRWDLVSIYATICKHFLVEGGSGNPLWASCQWIEIAISLRSIELQDFGSVCKSSITASRLMTTTRSCKTRGMFKKIPSFVFEPCVLCPYTRKEMEVPMLGCLLRSRLCTRSILKSGCICNCTDDDCMYIDDRTIKWKTKADDYSNANNNIFIYPDLFTVVKTSIVFKLFAFLTQR
jgi:hypothetical protein